MQSRLDPLEDLVGDLFVDRHDELAYFWKWATRIPSPMPHDSHALIGRRRTGKTTIMAKLFNRLYHEQDKVMPVYISFAENFKKNVPILWGDFVDQFLLGYLRSSLAFRYREPILMHSEANWNTIRDRIKQLQDEATQQILANYDAAKASKDNSLKSLASWVVNLPRSEAAIRNMPTVVLIDEFQVLGNAFNEERKIEWPLTSLFQNAAETHWAPLLVSGSAVSTLVNEIFSGALLGRIRAHHLPPLPREYAIDLVFRLGKRNSVVVNEEVAEAIWQTTEGSANAITSILSSASPDLQHFPSLEALEAVVNFELSHTNGNLGQYYKDEFDKYGKQLNGGNLTQKVMFAVSKAPKQDIHVEQLAKELAEKPDEVQAVLEKLYQIDVISKEAWTLYIGPNDPMLCRYIQYTYRRINEQLPPAEALKDWKAEYTKLQGTLNRFVGEVGEVYLQGVMHRFDGRTLDGVTYFNHAAPVTVPKFSKVERGGGVVVGGKAVEIDLQGEWKESAEAELPSLWLVQVKNWKTPIGEPEVQTFLADCEKLLQQKPAAQVVRWYFSKNGFSAPALTLLQQAGVLYSDRQSFNQLAQLFDFTGLP